MDDREWPNGVTEVDGGFRCPCGLVWAKSFEAIGCKNRGHEEVLRIRSLGSPPVAGVSVTDVRSVKALRRED